MREEWIADHVAKTRLMPRDAMTIFVPRPPPNWSFDADLDTTWRKVTLERVLAQLPEGTVVMAWRYGGEIYLPFPDVQ
jgi:hypothetical protein